MKKIISALMGVLLMGSVAFAQSVNPSKAGVGSPNAAAQANKNSTPAQVPASERKSVAKPGQPLKKDGTPDMRHSVNKQEAAAPAQKLKSDGTPDMRYKANQKTTTSKTTSSKKAS